MNSQDNNQYPAFSAIKSGNGNPEYPSLSKVNVQESVGDMAYNAQGSNIQNKTIKKDVNYYMIGNSSNSMYDEKYDSSNDKNYIPPQPIQNQQNYNNPSNSVAYNSKDSERYGSNPVQNNNISNPNISYPPQIPPNDLTSSSKVSERYDSNQVQSNNVSNPNMPYPPQIPPNGLTNSSKDSERYDSNPVQNNNVPNPNMPYPPQIPPNQKIKYDNKQNCPYNSKGINARPPVNAPNGNRMPLPHGYPVPVPVPVTVYLDPLVPPPAVIEPIYQLRGPGIYPPPIYPPLHPDLYMDDPYDF